ncbi:MAG TPA: hypothetical protein VH969_22575 [Actinophytocola sp.]|jgi:hypothetical protein|uniref:hypothetical protein n=1 Tax=Actinophytocola sp. TaxID=1872138 RepID=UPI002F943E9A
MERSEQEEHLELDDEPSRDEPAGWQRHDPDVSAPEGEQGVQFTTPDGGEPGDEEPDEVAEEHGKSVTAGPEQQAMRESGGA